MSHFTTGDGCRIGFDYSPKAGRPTLVLAHALGTSRDLFDPQIEAFSASFGLLRYDMRGHGASDTPPGGYCMDRLGRDVVELLDHVGEERVSLLGVSLGGMVGQWMGYRQPERIDRLVLANTSAAMLPPENWDERISAVQKVGMEPMVEPALERWFTPGYRASKPGSLDVIAQLMKATPAAGYAGCCAAIRDMDMRATAQLIEAECLVLYGEHDPATPPDHAEQLFTRIPKAQSVALNAAHLANIERPEDFTAAALDFLTGG